MSSSAISGPIFSDNKRAPAGTAAAPSFAFNDSTGTGVYLVSPGVLGLSTAGVQRVVVDANGSVGIGTASPSYSLHVRAGNAIAVQPTDPTNGATLRAINTGGTAYIGLDSSAGGLGAAYGLHMYHTGAYPIVFTTNNTERMRLDASGTLSIGGNFGYGGLSISKTGSLSPGVFIWLNATATNQKYISFEYNGNGGSGSITPNGTGNVAFNTGPSDHRLKEEVKPFTSGLQKVLELKPVSFKWKESQKEDYGFIAHELQEVIPEAVTGQKDAVNEEGKPDYQAIFPAPAQMIASLVSAIQEQQAQIEALKAEVAALKAP